MRCLQTSSKLYLVLDFINGGHLFFQLYRQVLGAALGHHAVSSLSMPARLFVFGH